MKILVGLICLVLSGCGFMDAGYREYTPVVTTDKDGRTHAKSVLTAAVSADMPGLKEMRTAQGAVFTFGDQVSTQEEAILNKDGTSVLAKITRTILPGFYPSTVIKEQGISNKLTIDSAAAGVTGSVIAIGTASATAGTPAAVSGAAKAFAP